MTAARRPKLKLFLRDLFVGFSQRNVPATLICAMLFALGIVSVGSISIADDIERAPSISTHGQAKRIVMRNKVEVLQLRGARSNPNFLEQSFNDSESKDVDRWNHQNDNITPVAGLKHKATRMPASELVKQPTPATKAAKSRKVALVKDDY